VLKPKSRTKYSRVISVTLVFLLILTITGVGSARAGHREDLRSYYPNKSLVRDGMYLEGFNYVSGKAERSVLWFELGRRGRFKQYNSAPDSPTAECHYDQMRWRKGVLRYSMTHDSCESVERETEFSPGIVLMPRRWTPGTVWSRSGTSDVTHREDGQVVCRGVNEWEATVLGWEEIAPGVEGIHVRSIQSTRWTDGQSSTGCSAGFTTDWQEDYYLIPELPVRGGDTAKAFKRSVGGNLNGNGRWDVWFDSWSQMPG